MGKCEKLTETSMACVMRGSGNTTKVEGMDKYNGLPSQIGRSAIIPAQRFATAHSSSWSKDYAVCQKT